MLYLFNRLFDLCRSNRRNVKQLIPDFPAVLNSIDTPLTISDILESVDTPIPTQDDINADITRYSIEISIRILDMIK
jgi:hypothetical protein